MQFRHFFLTALSPLLFMACNPGGSGGPDENNAHASDPIFQKGKSLVEVYQCGTCHKANERLTGPSHKEVAEKYANADVQTIDRLAKKIIEGGSGAWGTVPMTPHPNVSDEDARTMVAYILMLK